MKVSLGCDLEDHLLVELADADGFAFGVGEEDAVEAAIGDGSGIEDGEARGAVASGDHVADAVPGEAGAQFGEFVGGVAAAEQIEDAFEGGAGESAERSGAANEVDRGRRRELRASGSGSSGLRMYSLDSRIAKCRIGDLYLGRFLAFEFFGRVGACDAGRVGDDGDHLLARTSSGLRGKRVDSMWPSCMARVTAAQATRSARYLGKRMPSLTAST